MKNERKEKMKKGYYCGNWVISIDGLTVKARKRKYGECYEEYTFNAKSSKQAWFAYYNPFKTKGFIPEGNF